MNLGREAPSRPVRACARTLELESHRAVVKRGLVQARAEAVALAPLLFAPRVSGGMADAIPARLAHVRAVGRALAHNVLLFARVGRERDVRLRCRWPLTDVPRRCWNALKCISSTECRHTASLACSPRLWAVSASLPAPLPHPPLPCLFPSPSPPAPLSPHSLPSSREGLSSLAALVRTKRFFRCGGGGAGGSGTLSK